MSAKMPPPEKIYEAWSALADGRVELSPGASTLEGDAFVASSNRTKTCRVTWHDTVFSSDDNASYWQGYPGYPVIAVLMRLGLLPYDAAAASLFAQVDWNAANKRAGADYAKALTEVENMLDLSAAERKHAADSADTAYRALADLNLTLKRPQKKRRADV